MPTLPTIPRLIEAMNALERSLSDFEASLVNATSHHPSADGAVVTTVDGRGRLVSLRMDPSLLASHDRKALAELLVAQINLATSGAATGSAAAAHAFAEGLSLPGLPAHGGPPPDYDGFAATSAAARALPLANQPCHAPSTFQCRYGGVTVTVNAERKLVALVLDEPLSEDVAELESDLVGAINCAVTKSDNPPEGIREGVDAIVGTSFNFEGFVLYASSEVQLDQASSIRGLNDDTYGAIANAGSGRVLINHAATTGDIVSRGDVAVAPAARVRGSVSSQGKVTVEIAGRVDGPIREQTAVMLPALAFDVPFPSAVSSGVNLLPAMQASAAPAYYRQILLGAASKLRISSGVYYTDTLFLEGGSKLVIDASHGPVVLWVRNKMVFRGTLKDAAEQFPRVWIGYLGADPLWLVTPFHGSIACPSTTLVLAAPGPHVGSFFAKKVHVSYAQVVRQRPFELPLRKLPGLTLR